MKKLLTLLTLLVVSVTGAWASQTIGEVRLPDIPSSTLDMSSQTDFSVNASGWIVFDPYGDASSKTYMKWDVQKTQTEDITSVDFTSFTAPFYSKVSSTAWSRLNKKNNESVAFRFTGAEKASFLVNPRGNRTVTVALYSYNGESQSSVESKSCTSGSGFKEILFENLTTSTNYIAYIYTSAESNCIVCEIAVKKPVDTTPAAVSITSPASDPDLVAITQGQTTTLSITATGYPAPEYQWYRNTSKSTTGATELTGANSASYTTPSDLAVGTWYYYCVVDNTSGDPATSPYFSVKINALGADLTSHTPGTYESTSASGYGQTLVSRTIDDVVYKYEIYAMGSASSKNYWFAGTRTTTPSDTNCLSSEGFTTSFAASNITGSWMKGEVTGRGTSFNTATEEFPAQSSNCYTLKINSSDKSIMIKVSGYDQINILGKDNNTTNKHFVVKINGVEQDMTLNNSSYTVRRFTLDPETTSVIEISGSTASGDNHFVGFSLRLPIDTATPTISTEQDDEDATIGTPLDLSVTASHYTSLQWYKAEESDLSDATAIDGATSATYSFTAVKADALKTYYFYCVATNENATGEDETQSSTITVTVGDYEKSTACKALQVVYSNGFDAFITHPAAVTYYEAEDEEVVAGTKNVGDVKTPASNGRVVAYYVAGTSAPTISSTTLSDEATYNVVGTTLTVTAEDGTTTGVYDISLTAVEPYTGGDITFDGTESWVKAPYGFDDAKGYKYQRLKRDGESSDPWDRLTPGNTRIYMFLGANTSVTIKTTNSNGNVDVKVNTTLAKNNQSWGDSKAIEVTNDLNAPYLLGIYSHQTSGDNYVSSIAITKPTSVSATIPASGWGSYCSSYALDFSDAATECEAYAVSAYDVENLTVTYAKQTGVVPAGTGILLKGDTGAASIVVSDEAGSAPAVNKLVGFTAATDYTKDGATRYLGLSGGNWKEMNAGTIPANKAVLEITASELTTLQEKLASGDAKFTIIFDEGQTDGIASIENGKLNIETSVYNLAGQKVDGAYKGIVIVNGKKVVRK